ncbi:MAG: Asp23/Gls24 family envelope stress response protein [Candidatus Syntrophonatronum acetioxidans]|uniref:Asp23/Gls24 family envelope stress response protein n=1 Tax=Candidatus Syntrophonatronum acetioxidans TaxID=1795816 RepID=A0A424YHU3_9FIRM|nr:MAG: Asp23/Gls24 family envelope stress response protein [Candidatus Syntrophonatronum acetioxidans]
MGNSYKTSFGNITISKEVIALIAGMAAAECYGIVGMASWKISDGISELLKMENLSKGVEVDIAGEDLVINLYIVVGYGTKINQVALNVMEKVKYGVESKTGLKTGQVNINVQGVKVI